MVKDGGADGAGCSSNDVDRVGSSGGIELTGKGNGRARLLPSRIFVSFSLTGFASISPLSIRLKTRLNFSR